MQWFHFSFRFNDLAESKPFSETLTPQGEWSFPKPSSSWLSLWLGSTLAVSLGLFISGCQEPKARTYTEVAFKPNAAPASMMGAGEPMVGGSVPPMMNSNPVNIKVTWKLPETWAIKDSANAMRIGSFSVPDPKLANMGEMDPRAVDVSVIQLAGDAGGLKANLTRWMGQIGLKASPEEMDDMIKSAKHFNTKTKQDGIFVDFTEKLSGDMTQSKSIFGAIIQTADYTVFVKAMGEIERVVKVKAQIKAFCESLVISGPKA